MAEEFSTGMAMVPHAISSKKRSAKNEKLCLEDYIHLLHSRNTNDLTMNQLNQVIRIHGFKKIHHAPKKVLTDAVDAIDLVDLPRSTLSESISVFAVLTVEEAVADLSDLNWQECCVTSIQKFGCCEDRRSFPALVDQNQLQSQSHCLIPETSKRKLEATKLVPRRKRSSIQSLHSSASIVDSASLVSC
ncbi:uncharacterized protein [Medicago truncatula]|uniref:DUF7787 domain-containing protein n=1 Tax=Medicago truncatula TaxID=3880 RepID=G7JCK3_MEDTR|nr:uncharacterized protein LOC11414123 [Medicago truncatula]AES89772.1 hypothetical protein MTR_4g079810 [Medicago truncatula]